ncbi:hypothetical protein [Bartonella sp. CL162QHHD]|uniref:hypothetical protein n=1 Tax=Bartonella sp. CL162QHHD TaxID=3243516 RepID=UPI0035D0843E
MKNTKNIDFDYIYNSFISRFYWKCNYFENVFSPFYIEKSLFKHGMLGLFEDETQGFLLLPCEAHLQEGEPTEYKCSGSGYSKIINKENIVILRNGISSDIPSLIAKKYAESIYSIFQNHGIVARTLENAVSFPINPESPIQNLENLRKHLETSISVADPGSLIQNLEDLWQQRDDLLNEAFSILGLKKGDNFIRCVHARETFVKNCKDRFNFDISFKSQYEYQEELSSRLR